MTMQPSTFPYFRIAKRYNLTEKEYGYVLTYVDGMTDGTGRLHFSGDQMARAFLFAVTRPDVTTEVSFAARKEMERRGL